MDPVALPPHALAVVAVIAALALIALGAWIAGWMRAWDQRARVRHAQWGEGEAERILTRAGYTVVQRQATARGCMAVDGAEVQFAVRADLIVQRKGRRYVAEVKTGANAPDPCFPATRRQLLEYSLVFGAARVLLVDVPGRTIHTVTFPEVEIDEG